MAERLAWNDAPDDLEALIRSAGDYVQPSDDLRPSVLESARDERGEIRVRRWIGCFAACVVLLVLFAPLPRGSGGPDSPIEARAPSLGASIWELVDAFTDLRRHQSEALGAKR